MAGVTCTYCAWAFDETLLVLRNARQARAAERAAEEAERERKFEEHRRRMGL